MAHSSHMNFQQYFQSRELANSPGSSPQPAQAGGDQQDHIGADGAGLQYLVFNRSQNLFLQDRHLVEPGLFQVPLLPPKNSLILSTEDRKLRARAQPAVIFSAIADR